jgi:hypothetical protein
MYTRFRLLVDLYGTFTCLVQSHMWDVHLHHIQILNILNILMSNAQNIFYMLKDCHITFVGIPLGCDLFTIYDSYIYYVFS